MQSICKKQLLGLTGLLLVGFLGGHLGGNLFLFGGADSFNGYAQHLANLRPGLLLIEGALGLLFITHIITALNVWFENQAARPIKYIATNQNSEQSLASKTMPYTGLFILLYLIWHLFNYTYAFGINHQPGLLTIKLPNGTVETKDFGLYGIVYASFKFSILNTLFYVIAMCVIGFHISHGFASALQTFGFSHKKYTPIVEKLSKLIGLIVAVAFSSIALYILIFNPINAISGGN